MDPHRAQLAEEFMNYLEAHGVAVDLAAAEAHCTMAKVEAHANYLRMMRERVLQDIDIEKHEIELLLHDLTSSKNQMSAVDGYSPSQWVLGKNPMIPAQNAAEKKMKNRI